MNRRQFIVGALGLSSTTLPGCANLPIVPLGKDEPSAPAIPPSYINIYGALPEEKFPIPAVDLSRVPRRYWRTQVPYPSPHPVGSVVIDTQTFFLHLVQENGMAIRYGVGLGRQGFNWSGQGVIQWKQAWPKWTPPNEMIERQPELAKWSADNGGMPPGLDNPLGARAMYIFQNGEDTLYRIHGSPEFWTIGKAVSSGCVRMINQDVIDLFSRVTDGARLLVI